MQRRTVLKNIGLSFGALTLTPTVASLLQSCQESSTAAWAPQALSKDHARFLAQVMDVILPTTPNVPGASDLNLIQFIDGYLKQVVSEEELTQFTMGTEVFVASTLKATQKNTITEVTTDDIDQQLAYYLRASEEDQAKRGEALNAYFQALAKNENPEPPMEGVAQGFLNQLRSLTLFAFKSNEIIGEQHLAYAPVPGQQKGCVDLEEATNGKAWSL